MLLSKRQLMGLLVSPLFAPFVFYVIVAWPDLFSAEYGIRFDVFFSDALFTVVLIGTPISYLIAIFLGIPILKIVEKFNKITFSSIVLGGGVVAILPILATEIGNGTFLNYSESLVSKFNIYLTFFVCGVAVGIVFWFVSVRSNRCNSY